MLQALKVHTTLHTHMHTHAHLRTHCLHALSTHTHHIALGTLDEVVSTSHLKATPTIRGPPPWVPPPWVPPPWAPPQGSKYIHCTNNWEHDGVLMGHVWRSCDRLYAKMPVSLWLPLWLSNIDFVKHAV